MNNKNKNKLLIISIISIALILVLGITYAWLTQVLNGTQVNRIKAGTLDLVLDDNASNGIDIEYAIPQSDEQGLNNQAYTFRVINNGTLNASYKLYLDDEELEDGQVKIGDAYVKYDLVRNSSANDPKLLSTTLDGENKRVLDDVIINGKATNEYSLRLWIDSEATNEEVANKVFKAKIRIEAIQTEETNSVYTLTGYIYDSNDSIVTNGIVVAYSNPTYAVIDNEGKFSLSGLEDGKHTLYYIPNKTINEIKELNQNEIEQISNVGKASIHTGNNDTIELNNGNVIKNSMIKKLEIGDEFLFDYIGKESVFTAPIVGKYELEVWGAQGGSYDNSHIGGYGGYSTGIINLTTKDILYVNVGGQGTSSSTGGYNGGGNGKGIGGGGATHIALNNNLGLLSNYGNSKSDLVIVAGGGGGASWYVPNSCQYANGAAGGGATAPISWSGICKGRAAYMGVNSWYKGTGGSQTGGGVALYGTQCTGGNGAFGQGGSITSCSWSRLGGGGGGYYGGAAASIGENYDMIGATGGSGYIGNSMLKDKMMVTYTTDTYFISNDDSSKTIITANASNTAQSNYAKQGNGYAKITYLGK